MQIDILQYSFIDKVDKSVNLPCGHFIQPLTSRQNSDVFNNLPDVLGIYQNVTSKILHHPNDFNKSCYMCYVQ